MNILDFLHTLFDKGEKVCYSSTPFGTATSPREAWKSKDVYFSINPLNGTRADANVFVFRNILIEFDHIPLATQRELVRTIPYSTLVFSGSKSIHAIISLEQPCKSAAEYRNLVERIYKKLPQADPANKNPSRFSRLGGQFRADSGQFQTILDIRHRITPSELNSWLGPVPPPSPRPKPKKRRVLGTEARRFLRLGAPEGFWNLQLFKTACEMARCNIEEDEALELVGAINGYLTRSDKRTIRSAYKTVSNS